MTHHFKRALAALILVVTGAVAGTIAVDQVGAMQTNSSISNELVTGAPTRVFNGVRTGTFTVNVGSGFLTPSCIKAVHVNITGHAGGAAGFAVAWGGGSQPGTSLVNFNSGISAWEANAATVPVFVSGSSVFIQIHTTVQAHILVDVLGLYINC